MYPDERVARFVEDSFLPVRVHVKEQAADFQAYGDRYGAHWTPTVLVLDPDGVERHRVEGFLPADELLPQLMLGLGQVAFHRKEWKEAERRFGEVAKSFPDGDAAPEGRYWMGVSRYKASGEASELTATEAALRERWPDSVWTRKASVWKK